MSQLIFVMSRARKDIKMSISFPCTQVRIPDKDYWGNIVKGIRYISGTLHPPLILRDNILNVIKWRLGVSFAVHPDCNGHTRAFVSMGSGSIMEVLRNQKINRRISMKAKIVGADNALPQCLWLIEVQGYVVEELELHQDNMRAIC